MNEQTKDETRANMAKPKAGKGPVLHPRSLARSVGKAMGAGKDWRKAVASLPRTGRKRIHPKPKRDT